MTNYGAAAARPALRAQDFSVLQRAIDDAAAGVRTLPEPLVLTVGVSGGAPSERFLYTVKLDGAGRGEYRLVDELNDQELVSAPLTVGDDDVARIFGLLRTTAVLEPARPHTFPPDALVGFVTVRAGKAESRTLFPVLDAAPGADEDTQLVALPSEGEALRVDPDQVPGELIAVFGAMTAIARSARLVHEA